MTNFTPKHQTRFHEVDANRAYQTAKLRENASLSRLFLKQINEKE